MDKNEIRATLGRKLDEAWAAYQHKILEHGPAHIFNRANEIAATEQMYHELREGGYPADLLEYLLRFENPLEVVRDKWLDANNVSVDEEMTHALWDLADKGDAEQVYDLDTAFPATPLSPAVPETTSDAAGAALRTPMDTTGFGTSLSRPACGGTPTVPSPKPLSAGWKTFPRGRSSSGARPSTTTTTWLTNGCCGAPATSSPAACRTTGLSTSAPGWWAAAGKPTTRRCKTPMCWRSSTTSRCRWTRGPSTPPPGRLTTSGKPGSPGYYDAYDSVLLPWEAMQAMENSIDYHPHIDKRVECIEDAQAYLPNCHEKYWQPGYAYDTWTHPVETEYRDIELT